VTALEEALVIIQKQLPALRVVFTVSPVRHIRDGIEQDRLSKSVLRWAVHKLTEKKEDRYYFPAYELLTDDLRDYRFYGRDLAHPAEVAVDYIWKHFKQACIADSEYALMAELEKLSAATGHRPFDAGSDAHREFVARQLVKIDQLEAACDFLDLSAFRRRLENS
jgi:hypothetical protein